MQGRKILQDVGSLIKEVALKIHTIKVFPCDLTIKVFPCDVCSSVEDRVTKLPWSRGCYDSNIKNNNVYNYYLRPEIL